jgi:hypothetical protein
MGLINAAAWLLTCAEGASASFEIPISLIRLFLYKKYGDRGKFTDYLENAGFAKTFL